MGDSGPCLTHGKGFGDQFNLGFNLQEELSPPNTNILLARTHSQSAGHKGLGGGPQSSRSCMTEGALNLLSREVTLSMVATPSEGFSCPHWRSNCLSPTGEQKLDIEHLGRASTSKPPDDGPLWEEALIGKIRTMSALQKSQALEAVQCHIREHTQLIRKEVPNAGLQELLAALNLELKQPLEKTFLFHFYGLILRECACVDLVRRHLASLLELSHQSSGQREGIAVAIGIVSSRHMQEVWATLEHVGRTRFLRTVFTSPDSQQPETDTHWRWAGSTSLLCYGQMAAHAGAQILPWVDNIVSRMVYYFSCSRYDNILKTSFLSATIMLLKALRQNSTPSYKFSQIPELIQCLLCILQKEPNFLTTLFREKIILVIVGLSNLRPGLKPMVKSQILQTCLQSLYMLPPTETLRSSLPPLDVAPDVMALYRKSMQALDLLLQSLISENKSVDELCFILQHMEPWLKSDSSDECQRAVQTIFLFLKYVVDYVGLTVSRLTRHPREGSQEGGGHPLHAGPPDRPAHAAVEGQGACHPEPRPPVRVPPPEAADPAEGTSEFTYLNKMKNFEANARRESEMKFYDLVKVLDGNLTVAQHTQLVLTLLRGLCSHNHLRCDLASQLLLMIVEDHSIKAEQVAEILQGLFQELPSIIFKNTLQTVMQAVSVLGTQHTQETVKVILSLCHPSESISGSTGLSQAHSTLDREQSSGGCRQVIPLWKALANNTQLARKVLTLLYMKLRLRPPKELVRFTQQAELISLLALGTIYELLYIREYKATVRWAFAGVLVGLLTQLRYLFELDVVDGISDYQEDVLDGKPLSPCRTCLEALKGLFWTTNYWEVFAYLKLLRGWELFEHMETYTEGVTLLARAMAHYDCEVKAVLGQAVISLKSSEERDNIVAILIITEFLNSHELTQYMSRRTVDNFLSLGLNNPNQLVRAMSLKGLSSALMHPEKVMLLRNRLAGLLDGFVGPEPKDLMGLMDILGDILHRLGAQGVGATSLRMAQHLLQLFDDEQADVRGGAILLYGDVLYSGGKKYQQALKNHAFQALVPLLFHLADSCPKVVMKTKLTFLRCAVLLKWEFRKELFGKLAWGRGLSAENDVFIYTVESNLGNYHQFLMQALTYLSSPDRNLKQAAMKFIRGMLQDYFPDLCICLRKADVRTLRKHLEILKQDPDSMSRRFYSSFLEDIWELSQYVTH
ncbi:maestro heat-like repeat family member 5 isoform X3 [Acinonyx jubatus]|uniref:Maestro heat-like repeat family member 5 isoform X3 n=1 Tax=Acinonyx jubatus TaxID=32536 RepID=A0ABM3NXQ5_ACIJB|nr:maestro heat-like repeat family member 5 isoform X3 [Acinonyx jubatus]